MNGFPLLQRLKLGQLFAVLFNQIGEMQQDTLTLCR